MPIVFDNTALAEIMHLGFYGHLVPDRDERALADKLLYVCRISLRKNAAPSQMPHARRRSFPKSASEMSTYNFSRDVATSFAHEAQEPIRASGSEPRFRYRFACVLSQRSAYFAKVE